MLQRALAVMLLQWWEADIVTQLVKKNIRAHRQRHRKTVIVFSVAVAFIVFLNVSYQIQVILILF